MRHLVKQSKLNKSTSHRKAMLKNLAAQVIQYEAVETTSAKAKAVVPIIDRLINMGKLKDLAARRNLQAELFDELAVKKILEVLVDRYEAKKSGFTSIVKIGKRSGDSADMVKLILLEK